MRLLLILILLAPALHAIDVKDVDGETLRYARLALLKDDVRKHFGLRIGDFEPLDQALSTDVKMGAAGHLVVLRLKRKAAAVLIQKGKGGDEAGAFCLLEVEHKFRIESLMAGKLAVIRCAVSDKPQPERTRLLRLKDGKLQDALNWLDMESRSWQGGRYVRKTNRKLISENGALKLFETSDYYLDDKKVEGGHSDARTSLVDIDNGLKRGTRTENAISLSTHCAIARRLERDGLNRAALHHAELARQCAKHEKLPQDDAGRLEAMALVARLEARLHRNEVVER